MVKEAYVSFELAKLLKEKGFDEKCYAFYEYDSKEFYREERIPCCNSRSDDYAAPTHQMAIAWLRTKHIIIVVQPEYFNADGICSYWGVDIWTDDNYEKLQGDFPSYEEAVETALKYCLENLI